MGKTSIFCNGRGKLIYQVGKFINQIGPNFLEVKIDPGSRKTRSAYDKPHR